MRRGGRLGIGLLLGALSLAGCSGGSEMGSAGSAAMATPSVSAPVTAPEAPDPFGDEAPAADVVGVRHGLP